MPKDKHLVGTSKRQIHELDYVAAEYDLTRDQVRDFIKKIKDEGGKYRSRKVIEAAIEAAGFKHAEIKPITHCGLVPDWSKKKPLSRPKWKPDPLPQPTPTPKEGKGGRKPKPPAPTPTPTPTPTPQPTGVIACLYMNFDGGIVMNPQWNGGNQIVCAPSNFTAAQRAQALVQAQAAYQKYNITVTDDRAIFDKALRRQEVIITPTSAWYTNLSFTGVAKIGSMFMNALCPVFVFTDRLHEVVPYVGAIMIHEAGHAIGLVHQSEYTSACQFIQTYKPGAHMGYPFNTAEWISQPCSSQHDDQFLTNQLGLR